jgi:serine acetyltransferase
MALAATPLDTVAVDEPEIFGWGPALEQLRYLGHELRLITGGKSLRWLVLFFEPRAGVVISYRLDRGAYLCAGKAWTALRVLAFPMFLFLRVLSCHHEICFKAKIGKGLQIWHPTLGIVVNGDAIIGDHCLFYGGNSVGVRRGIRRGELVLGNNVTLGINACVLGPVRIGNQVTIGAGAVVVRDLPDDCTAIGVPARVQSTG